MREKIVYTLGILGTILLLWNFYNIFLVIPIDALQGDIFRIIFIHVPAAITAYTFYAVAVVASIGFLVKKNFAWDSLAVSAVEVGTMFTLVNLATGSIWGRVEWGIWWAWDARMTSQLMLLPALSRLSADAPRDRRAPAARRHVGRPRDLRRRRHPHRHHGDPAPQCTDSAPRTRARNRGLAPVYWPPFLTGIVAFLLLGTAMMLVRLHQETSRREIDSLRRELHAYLR